MKQPDIRPALIEVIRSLEEQLADYKRVLERENHRLGGSLPVTTGENSLAVRVSSDDMPDVIVNILKVESMDKPSLIKKVSAIHPFNLLPVPGRSVHAHLMNLLRSGQVKQSGDKYYVSI
ncbi:MAG: hypothetical protein JNM12_03775 [Alphaproteobacteria bacterium]|nr:hypothetical protein [Alphaproteobacteria bacterium]